MGAVNDFNMAVDTLDDPIHGSHAGILIAKVGLKYEHFLNRRNDR